MWLCVFLVGSIKKVFISQFFSGLFVYRAALTVSVWDAWWSSSWSRMAQDLKALDTTWCWTQIAPPELHRSPPLSALNLKYLFSPWGSVHLLSGCLFRSHWALIRLTDKNNNFHPFLSGVILVAPAQHTLYENKLLHNWWFCTAPFLCLWPRTAVLVVAQQGKQLISVFAYK